MKLIRKLLVALLGFAFGAALAIYFVGIYIRRAYPCAPGASEPCDLAGVAGFGMVLNWAPICGLLFALLAYWLVQRRQRRGAG